MWDAPSHPEYLIGCLVAFIMGRNGPKITLDLQKYCHFTAHLWHSGSLLTHSFGPKWSLGTCLWFLVPTGHSLPSLCAIRPFRSAQKPYKNGLKLTQKLDFRCPIWANFVVFLDSFSTNVLFSFFLYMTSLTILTYHWNLVEYFKTLKNGQKLGLKVSQKWRFHFLYIILTNAHFCPSLLALGKLWGYFLSFLETFIIV